MAPVEIPSATFELAPNLIVASLFASFAIALFKLYQRDRVAFEDRRAAQDAVRRVSDDKRDDKFLNAIDKVTDENRKSLEKLEDRREDQQRDTQRALDAVSQAFNGLSQAITMNGIQAYQKKPSERETK